MLNFVTQFSQVVKSHIEETSDILGKEVIDSSANKTGICVDKIKVAYGAKFSMLGHNYKESDMKEIDRYEEDVLVCQGGNGFFFIPVSNVKAHGQTAVLVDANLKLPEMKNMNRRRSEVFGRFSKTRRSIKDVIPQVEAARARARGKKKRSINFFY